MFSNRPPVPPGSGGSYKFTVVETCDRIKEEFNYIQQQNHSLLMERDKLVGERSDMQRICVMYYEMANGMNLEMHRQTEIAKRISAILTQVMPFLSQEHQSQVLSAIERAKQVTMQELNSVLAAQIEDAKSSKFFNGSNAGLMAEQLEAYKISMLSGTPPSSLPSALHGLNMSHPGGTSGYMSTTSTPSSMAAGGLSASSLPSLSPPNHPTISAALLNGLMSVGNIPAGAQAPFLNPAMAPSLTSGRDTDKFGNDEKQRAAAMAAAAAAGSFLFGGAGATGGRSAANGSSLLPPPTNPLAGILGASLADFPGAGFPGTFPPLLPGSGVSSTSAAASGGSDITTTDLVSGNAMFSSNTASGNVSIGGTSSQQPSRSASAGSGGGGSSGRQTGGSQLSQNPNAVHPNTGGSSSVSSTSHHDEKRRKFNDSRDSTSHENGSWPSAVDFRAASDRSAGCNRRSGGGPQHTSSSSPHFGPDGGSSYPTTSSAPAVNSTPGAAGGSGSGRSSQISEFPNSRWRSSSKNISGPGAYSLVVLPGGQTKPCSLASAPGATTAPGLPRRLQHIASLPHGDVVCSVTIGPCPVGRASSLAAATDAVSGDDEGSSPNPTTLSPHFAYTGARGGVKLWDLVSINSLVSSGASLSAIAPLATYDCLCPDSYVRSIKLFPDASSLIIGGESKALTLWDLTGTGRRKAELTFEAPACYALALSSDGKLCYSCCSDGYVSVWDVHNQSIVHLFHGHVDGTSCVELASDGVRLWTGGLDHKVCCWDIRGSSTRALNSFEFKSQVFSLGLTCNTGTALMRRPASSLSPSSGDGDSTSSAGPLREAASPQSCSSRNWSSSSTCWLAVGLESSEVEVIAVTPDGSSVMLTRDDQQPPPLLGAGGLSPVYGRPPSAPLSQPTHFRLTHHESCVLALRFAHHGDWFLTTGKDHLVNAWRTPYGACLLETKEAASVLTCDISPDDKFVVTGSGDKRANLYEVIYAS